MNNVRALNRLNIFVAANFYQRFGNEIKSVYVVIEQYQIAKLNGLFAVFFGVLMFGFQL